MHRKVTFAELVKRAGEPRMTLLASHEAPVLAKSKVQTIVTTPSKQAMSAAQVLVGSLPGSDSRVMRVAKKLDRLVTLAARSNTHRRSDCGSESAANG
jgi:hypothetical protein